MFCAFRLPFCFVQQQETFLSHTHSIIGWASFYFSFLKWTIFFLKNAKLEKRQNGSFTVFKNWYFSVDKQRSKQWRRRRQMCIAAAAAHAVHFSCCLFPLLLRFQFELPSPPAQATQIIAPSRSIPLPEVYFCSNWWFIILFCLPQTHTPWATIIRVSVCVCVCVCVLTYAFASSVIWSTFFLHFFFWDMFHCADWLKRRKSSFACFFLLDDVVDDV